MIRRHLNIHKRKKRKLQTGILTYPLKTRTQPQLVDTRQMDNRHLVMQGRFEYHHHLKSQFLDATRSVIVYLPPGYSENPRRRYPVLYAHDGNNLFDPATAFMGREWRLDDAIEHQIRKNNIHKLIVVGIYNTADRMEEYTCHPHLYQEHYYGGLGQNYARFLVEELKPMIDGLYRTLPTFEHTGMMGSSLGAIISFYTALLYPHLFSKLALMSPTVYWSNHQILKDVPHFPRHCKVWVDIGTEEGVDPHTEETVESTQAFVHALERIGYYREHNLKYYVDYWAGHDEYAWANRVAKPLKFLFGKEDL